MVQKRVNMDKTSWYLGFKPPHKNQIFMYAKRISQRDGVKFSVASAVPILKWFFRFRTLYNVSKCVVRHLSEARAKAPKNIDVGEWYASLKI